MDEKEKIQHAEAFRQVLAQLLIGCDDASLLLARAWDAGYTIQIEIDLVARELAEKDPVWRQQLESSRRQGRPHVKEKDIAERMMKLRRNLDFDAFMRSIGAEEKRS